MHLFLRICFARLHAATCTGKNKWLFAISLPKCGYNKRGVLVVVVVVLVVVVIVVVVFVVAL